MVAGMADNHDGKCSYDNYGQLAQLKTYRSGNNWSDATWPASAPVADLTTWSYDAPSGLITTKTDAANNATTYTYTVDGKLAGRTWARKINNQALTTNYSYNTFGELTAVTYPSGTGIPITTNLAFTYNRLGQPLTVTDAAGTHTFTYNSTFGVQKEAITGSFYTQYLNYTYTSTGWKGQPLNLKLGSDDIYTYNYDARLSGVTLPAGTVGYSWGSNNRISQIGIPSMPTDYSYTGNLISSVSFGFGMQPPPSAAESHQYFYTYDNMKRISKVALDHSYRDVMWAVAALDTVDVTYTYNPKSELISAVREATNTDYMGSGAIVPEATKSYAYNFDQIGNRTTANLAGTSWSYASNNLNQYTALTKSGTTSNPTYDADGNLLTYDGWTYTWNMENRLIKATKGPLMLSFQYDYMGRRIEKRVLNDAQLIKNLKYVYDGYKLVAEVDGMNNNTQLRRYTWNAPATGLDTPLAMYNVANNTTYYYRTGANKNVIALTNGTRVVGHYEYSPFGITIKQTGDMAATNPFRFSSEYHDDETGLIYYNYRYYNPTLGRWLSKDPIGEYGGMNLYGMVENNPINIWDILGLAEIEIVIQYNIDELPDKLSMDKIKEEFERVMNACHSKCDPCKSNTIKYTWISVEEKPENLGIQTKGGGCSRREVTGYKIYMDDYYEGETGILGSSDGNGSVSINFGAIANNNLTDINPNIIVGQTMAHEILFHEIGNYKDDTIFRTPEKGSIDEGGGIGGKKSYQVGAELSRDVCDTVCKKLAIDSSR